MTGSQVADLIEAELTRVSSSQTPRRDWIRENLVEPRMITVIDRSVREGEVHDARCAAWLVFEEHKGAAEGYRIVFDEAEGVFGLATLGFKQDQQLVMCGWHGDFMTTLDAM